MSVNKSPWNKKYKQGFYKLVNGEKYIGNKNNIKFRSSWEYAFCSFLDNNDKVTKWCIENPVITYFDLNNQSHRYYMDFYYEILTNDENQMDRVMVEIKPKKDLSPPEKPLNETAKALENYEYALKMHLTNKLKWSYAIDYSNKHNLKFVIITEDHLKSAGLLR